MAQSSNISRRRKSALEDGSSDYLAKRAELVEIAGRQFKNNGFRATTLSEIGHKAGLDRATVYYYFGSKDGLYAAVLERVYADLRMVEEATAQDTPDPLEALAQLIGSSFDSHVSNPERVRILMSENLDRGRHAREIDQTAQRELVVQTLGRILTRGEAMGVIRSGLDPIQLHMSISALAFYFVSNAHTFSKVFAIDMASAESKSTRRAEVVETIMSRCRA